MAERILDKINSPEDLKRLSLSQLERLAEEIRQRILEVVSRTGGHLASNLGVVELTLALLYIFDPPEDKIVWDVGHQTYTYKLLTGRREKFHTLRQYRGLSGFPKRDESPYDAFDTGHASTSVSAALGIAEGMHHRGISRRSIAVIGDGSMTGGLAFEGLNHAGSLRRNLIVVLNDNEMSISPNVGALSSYLSRITTGQIYHKFKRDIEHILKSIPSVGDQMSRAAWKLKEALKMLIVPVTMFDELGFEYFGPLRGHKLEDLIETFQAIKKLEGPILVHVLTKKGKGYPPAEERPHLFHSAAPFEIKTGCFKPSGPVPSYTSFFSQALIRLAEQDPHVVAITAAMAEGTGLNRFAERFPERFYDVGIAEQHAVTFAAGLSTQGLRPVVAVYSTFLQRAYDQLLHDVCLQNLPVAFALDRAGIVGADGPTHHGLFDFSYLRHLPNMVVMAPKDENELQHMLYTAVVCEAPAAVRYPRGAGIGVKLDKNFKRLRLGRAEVLTEGKDIAILAIGNTVYPALEAQAGLQKRGIQATVVNARFVKPLDRQLIIQLAKETGHLLTVEENMLQGGFGSAVLELLDTEGLTGVRTKRLGIPDVFIEHGSPQILRRKYHLDAPGITQAALQLLSSEQ